MNNDRKRIINARNRVRRYSRQFIKDKCENCDETFSLTIDHIIPLSQGGSKEKDNCRTLCDFCHRIVNFKDVHNEHKKF